MKMCPHCEIGYANEADECPLCERDEDREVSR